MSSTHVSGAASATSCGDTTGEAPQAPCTYSHANPFACAVVDISLGKQRHVHYRDSRLTW